MGAFDFCQYFPWGAGGGGSEGYVLYKYKMGLTAHIIIWWVLRTLDRSLSNVDRYPLFSLPCTYLYRVHAERDRNGCDCMFKRARLKDYSEKKTDNNNKSLDRPRLFHDGEDKSWGWGKRDINVVQNDWIKLLKLHKLSCL